MQRSCLRRTIVYQSRAIIVRVPVRLFGAVLSDKAGCMACTSRLAFCKSKKCLWIVVEPIERYSAIRATFTNRTLYDSLLCMATVRMLQLYFLCL